MRLDGSVIEYRCRVKHAYTPETILAAHAETEERTLWSAVVALEEGADLVENLSPTLQEDVKTEVQQKIARNRHAASHIRRLLEGLNDKAA